MGFHRMEEPSRTDAGVYALYPIRIAVAGVFIVAGWGKLVNFAAWEAAVVDLGFPMATTTAALVVIGELFGGIGVLLGILTRFSAGVHSLIMMTALATRILGGLGGWQLDVALLGGALALVINGPGRPTVTSVLELDVDDPEMWLWQRLGRGQPPSLKTG